MVASPAPSLLLAAPVLLVCHYAAYKIWAVFTESEVHLNAADIAADGSADTLRKGYHQRRTWARFWPWLCCVALASWPAILAPKGWGVALLPLGIGILLATYFARYFTPLLNVARGLPEFHASSDSASWPDAGAWKQVRGVAALLPHSWAAQQPQAYADQLLEASASRVWWWGRALYLLCLLAYLGLVGVGVFCR